MDIGDIGTAGASLAEELGVDPSAHDTVSVLTDTLDPEIGPGPDEISEVVRRRASTAPGGLADDYLPFADVAQVNFNGRGLAVLDAKDDVHVEVHGKAAENGVTLNLYRDVARRCPDSAYELADWVPADASGVHKVVLNAVTVNAPDGVPDELAARLAEAGRSAADSRPVHENSKLVRWSLWWD